MITITSYTITLKIYGDILGFFFHISLSSLKTTYECIHSVIEQIFIEIVLYEGLFQTQGKQEGNNKKL